MNLELAKALRTLRKREKLLLEDIPRMVEALKPGYLKNMLGENYELGIKGRKTLGTVLCDLAIEKLNENESNDTHEEWGIKFEKIV